MSEIDIRYTNSEEIKVIRFIDTGKTYCVLDRLSQYENDDGDSTHVWLSEENDTITDYSRAGGVIESKDHAENLIKALRKAIELGWLK